MESGDCSFLIKTHVLRFVCIHVEANNDCYNYYYFTPFEFFASVLAGGFPWQSKWQQASSDLQNSSKYPRLF